MHALVTGASGGLGEAYCHHLASMGLDIVLASRRVDELERVAADLRSAHGVEAVVIGCDLSDEQARDDLMAEIERRGIQLDALVNNAGFGTMGELHEADVARLNDEVQLNCGAVAHLTRLVLPQMLQRDHGAVINVASTAAFQAIPTMAVYAATKAFVLSFTEAVWQETRSTGVRVIAICPGPTDTAFFDVADDNAVMTRRRTPQQVVESTFRALDRRQPSVVDGSFNAVQARFARMVPAWIAAPVARRVASGGR